MNFADYVEFAAATAVYPREYAGIYPALGLAGELGELQEQAYVMSYAGNRDPVLDEVGDLLWYIAMWARDRDAVPATKLREYEDVGDYDPVDDLVKCSGSIAQIEKRLLRDGSVPARDECESLVEDCLYALGMIAARCDTTLSKIARRNLAKLAGRAKRGTLGGKGDDR